VHLVAVEKAEQQLALRGDLQPGGAKRAGEFLW